MKLENSLGLPEPIVNAIRGDDYTKGDCDFSVTELIKPIRIRALGKKWSEHLTEDVSDKIFSLFGRAMHKVLEMAADPRYCMVEKRYSASFGYIKASGQDVKTYWVSGQFDLLDYLLDTETRTLSDYKFTSRYAVGDGVKPDWEAQENMNAFILRQNGFKIDKLQIVAIFRDWSKLQASRSDDYPQKQVAILPVDMWKDIETESFIRARIKAHIEGEDNPPICTPEERWRKPNKWALMKKGNKRAVKLFDEEVQADIAAHNFDFAATKYYVEPRPGEDTRCLYYCGVNKFCSYFQSLMEDKVA